MPNIMFLVYMYLFLYQGAKKMLVTSHEQKRILQFNNQNLHSVNI